MWRDVEPIACRLSAKNTIVYQKILEIRISVKTAPARINAKKFIPIIHIKSSQYCDLMIYRYFVLLYMVK